MLIFMGVGTVDSVVGGHQASNTALFDGHFEGRQVDLPQGPLIQNGIVGHAAQFLGIGGVVLDAGGDAVALDTPDQCRRHFASQIGVFRKVFEIPAAKGTALDVDAGAQQDTDTLAGGFQAQVAAHFLQQFLVPGVGKARGGGVAGGGDGLVQAQMVLLAALLAQTVGAVGEHHAGDAQPWDGFGIPKVGAGHERGLFFQCHLCDQ